MKAFFEKRVLVYLLLFAVIVSCVRKRAILHADGELRYNTLVTIDAVPEGGRPFRFWVLANSRTVLNDKKFQLENIKKRSESRPHYDDEIKNHHELFGEEVDAESLTKSGAQLFLIKPVKSDESKIDPDSTEPIKYGASIKIIAVCAGIGQEDPVKRKEAGFYKKGEARILWAHKPSRLKNKGFSEILISRPEHGKTQADNAKFKIVGPLTKDGAHETRGGIVSQDHVITLESLKFSKHIWWFRGPSRLGDKYKEIIVSDDPRSPQVKKKGQKKDGRIEKGRFQIRNAEFTGFQNFVISNAVFAGLSRNIAVSTVIAMMQAQKKAVDQGKEPEDLKKVAMDAATKTFGVQYRIAKEMVRMLATRVREGDELKELTKEEGAQAGELMQNIKSAMEERVEAERKLKETQEEYITTLHKIRTGFLERMRNKAQGPAKTNIEKRLQYLRFLG